MIFVLLFCIYSLIFISTYFETAFQNSHPLGKTTSKCEQLFLIEKIVYIIYFQFIANKVNIWITIVFLFIISLLSFLYYLNSLSHYNMVLVKVTIVSKGIILWSSFSLLLGKIIQSILLFQSELIIFLLITPILFFILWNFSSIKWSDYFDNTVKLSKGNDFIFKIRLLLNLIDTFDLRESQIILRGYAFQIESYCTLKECPLKNYIESMNNKNEAIMYFIKHIDYLFQVGISKNSYDVKLRIFYSLFLIQKLYKKYQALTEFQLCERIPNITFEDAFIIYRYKRHYEEFGDFKFGDNYGDIGSSVVYSNYLNKFKFLISKVSILYIDFWSLLYENHLEHQQDLTRLNLYGTRINIEVNNIKQVFEKIQKVKPNDYEVLLIYYEFLSEILFDNEKANEIKYKLKEIEETMQSNQENEEYDNFDIHAINNSDKNYYMILDTRPNSFTVILNISMGLCPMLGYTKAELVGKPIDILIPYYLQSGHRAVLKDRIEKYIKKNGGSERQLIKVNFNLRTTFALTKSKYIIPFIFKFSIYHNENNELFWLIKVNREQQLDYINNKKDSIKNVISGIKINNPVMKNICYVFTNNSFIIQNFSGNSLKYLGFNYSIINNTTDITSFIKEFYEELLKVVIDEEKTTEHKLEIKKNIVNKKFRTPVQISWRIIEKERKKTSDLALTELTDNTELNYSKPKNKKENFLLTITDIILNNKQEGYIFKLEHLPNLNGSKERSYSITDNIGVNNSSFNISNMNLNDSKGKQRDSISLMRLVENKKTKDELAIKKNEEESQIIDKTFIPSISNKGGIYFDPITISYKINSHKDSSQINYLIKNKAIQKLNKITDGKKLDKFNTSSSSSYEETSEEGEEDDLEFITEGESDNEKRKDSKDIKGSLLTTKSMMSNKEDYYHVNLTKITFSIYDYKKQTCIDKPFDKRTKIEQIKDLSEDIIPQQEDIKSNETNIVTTSTNQQIDELEQANKKEYIIQQIKNSLDKEESQPTIIKLRIVSFIVFLIVITNGMIFYFLPNHYLHLIRQKMRNMRSSFYLLRYSLLNVNLMRELILLSFEEYDIFYCSKDEYIKNYTDELEYYYLQSSENINNLILRSTELESKHYSFIYDSKLETAVIESDYQVFYYNLTLISSVYRTVTSMFEVTHLKRDEVIPLNKDIFFFMKNTLNGLIISFEKFGDIYIEEIHKSMKSEKQLLYILFGCFIIFIYSSFFIISKTFSDVIKRKESYLEVFYEIGNEVILYSLEKCEAFAKRMQNNNCDFFTSSDESDTGIQEDFLQLNDTKNNTNSIQNSKGKGDIKSIIREHKNASKEIIIIKIGLFSFFTLLLLYSLIIILLFFFFINTVSNYITYFSNENIIQEKTCLFYIIMREYLFEPNETFSNLNIREYVEVMISNHLKEQKQRNNELIKNQNSIKEEYTHFKKIINEGDICNYTQILLDEYANNPIVSNCEDFLYGSLHYGSNLLISTMIEQLREIKRLFEVNEMNMKMNNITINLTTLGTADYYNNTLDYRNKKDLYDMYNPINLFKNNKMKQLQMLFRFVLTKVFREVFDALSNAIADGFDKKEQLILIMIIAYLVICFGLYILFWRGYVNSLTRIIYKTKNMLLIIPKEVLSSLTSIHKLLNITSTNIIHKK